ncbi:broad substrate specificity ATP-binding cassette transporter ABCG2-like [Kryptolebias marmoratus]|uniref:broad substrate specificity ATP-binding cassette transporter ABCG2-like n=1 Tax=Kryptolebias marmoratus TaxID=37003 RepID=UPI000D5307DF|nr:broad substrate specificity ATP-binding cassette transporter ABCG2-like [Kryptolebias marmoratus]
MFHFKELCDLRQQQDEQINISQTSVSSSLQIFAGLLVNVSSIVGWLSWLKYFSIPGYGLSALQINEFTGLNFCSGLNNTDIPPVISCTGEAYLEKQGIDYSTWGLWQNHLALIIMIFCFLSIAYLKLRFIKKFT